MSDSIRLGFVGAGNNTRKKHLPGFQQIAGVQLAGVCNSRPESTRQVAQEFGIQQTYANWQELVADEQIDAVVIGTWPHLHCEITCAALAAGKHVLTEARMASNLSEARQMQAAAQKFSDQVTMVVPSPLGLTYGDYLKHIIEHGFLGDLREVVVLGANDAFWDPSLFFHPRQSQELSGRNVLSLGILHETVSRWIPPTERVFAQTKIFETTRPVENHPDKPATITVPDSVQLVTQIAGGARGVYHFSGITLFGPGNQIHLYGTEGTIKIEFDWQGNNLERVQLGRHSDKALTLLELPAEQLSGWQVEADFIAAIRGEKPVTLNSFETALDYMEFTEAVHLSAEQNQPISLPLK